MFFGVLLALVGTFQPANAEPLSSLSEKAGATKALAGFWLLNKNSGKCALVRGGADNTSVVQNQCLDFADQKWILVSKGGDLYQIRNLNSGKCLLVRGADNNAPVVQNQCLDFADQYWYFPSYPGDPNWSHVKNLNSGKCLVVRGNSDNAPLVQFDCAQFADQAWVAVI
ncbi:RICIN domain-containing protein [Lentzea sp. NPDC092896]|uniref:RICIN domain-containing protein n=1 Tax=Lentzea sp. NPDC092896 TaxID=3364127 RepID=UPI00381B4A63